MENIIVLTALYVLIIGILYAPKCPAKTATETPINYFPSVEDEPLESIPCPWEGEPVKVTAIAIESEPVKPVLYLLPPAKEVPTKKSPKPTKKTPKNTDNNLSAMSIRQLKKLASERKIPRYSNLTKAQLIAAMA